MHWRTGKSEHPRPRSFAELAAKCFPVHEKKPGTLTLLCVNKIAAAKNAAKKSAESAVHMHTGIYGALARRLAQEGKIDAHYRFHSLEHGLLQASLGNDFTLYIEAGLCSLVEARVKRLEEKTGLRINLSHTHPDDVVRSCEVPKK